MDGGESIRGPDMQIVVGLREYSALGRFGSCSMVLSH